MLKIAERMRDSFTRKTRDSGESLSFYGYTDDAPQEAHDLVMAAHDAGNMMPDDHRYEMIVDVLDAIIDAEGDQDEALEIAEGSVPVYNSTLAAWLASHVYRGGYVDEAVSELGYPDTGIYGAIGLGYLYEVREVFQAVWEFLENLDDDESEEDE